MPLVLRRVMGALRRHAQGGRRMSALACDRHFREQLWATTQREHGDKVAGRPPNPSLLDAVAQLPRAARRRLGQGTLAR